MARTITDGLGMKHLFYEDWTNKRVRKIIDIFGEDWFREKKVLELGAAHGDIGIELLKLGADITFSDARKSHLTSIITKLSEFDYVPKTLSLNQNEEYSFRSKFDLVLHLGVLYHIQNWKQDLECALRCSDKMILETAVYPSDLMNMKHPTYGSYECDNPSFTQDDIEQHLSSLGCKFIRFDNHSLDSIGRWLNTNIRNSHLYSWNENNLVKSNELIHYRRFWLVLT